nr:hypothetical protein [Candidatus Cloacimonadota bacterium]
MGKVKSFAAKLAHDTNKGGKVMCPVCNTEVKRVKIIQNRKTDGTWRPDKLFVKICKCNESDIMSGKNI